MNTLCRSSVLRLAVLVLLAFTPARASADVEPIRVGAILPLTGDTAVVGVAVKDGIEMALDELKREGPVGIEVLYEDDQGDPKQTVSAYKKLVEVDKVQVVIAFASNTSKAIAPLADEAKIPLIAIATDQAICAGRSWVVNFWTAPEQEAAELVKEIRKRGYKSIAEVTATHDGSIAFQNAVDAENNGAVNVALREEVPVDLRDFRSVLTKIKRTPNIDAIYANVFLGQAGLFARQARELGINQPLFSIEFFEDANEVKASNGALIGQWYVQVDDPNSKFLDAFKKHFPGAPTFGAANGHDAILLISRGGKTPAEINTSLHTVKNFSGALGTFSATGNRFTLTATVKVVTKDGFQRLHE